MATVATRGWRASGSASPLATGGAEDRQPHGGAALGILGPAHLELREAISALPARINDFLGKAAALVRERFGGRITYASIPFEGVDWTPFDFVSVDAYRSSEIADRYRDRPPAPAVR